MFHIKQVYTDPRIPIIQRYRDNWATDEVAKTVAGARRKGAYASGAATRPAKYDYNVANSSKRDPKAPRDRWNSVTQSVNPKGKGKATQQTKEQMQDAGLREPEPPDPTNVNIHAADSHSPSLSTSIGPQDAGPSQLQNPSGM